MGLVLSRGTPMYGAVHVSPMVLLNYPEYKYSMIGIYSTIRPTTQSDHDIEVLTTTLGGIDEFLI